MSYLNLSSFLPFRRAGQAFAAPLHPYLRIQPGVPGTFVEHFFAPDFVFDGKTDSSIAHAHLLGAYSDAAHTLQVMFRPKVVNGPVAALVLCYGTGAASAYVYELPELGERANYRQVAALGQYQFLRDSLARAARPARASAMPGWGVALLVGLGLLSALLLFSPNPPQSPTQAAAQSAAPAAPTGPLLSAGDQLTTDEKKTLAQVVRDSGIELSSGAKPFVIFSDPNCPACRELEVQLAELHKRDTSLSPVVVPVSFKAGSKEAVEGVLCSGDVLGSWRAAVSGGAAAPSCAKGQAQAQTNNAAFVGLRLDRTPTIVTSSGKVAVGAKDFEGLVRWIKEHSND